MHPSSMHWMLDFKNRYLTGTESILEIGSYDVNGSYRPEFAGHPYIGLDMRPGPGVDVAVSNPNRYEEIEDCSFDAIISGSAFEHIEHDHCVMKEIARILKPGGICCIIAPSAGPQHDYPNDYRRYTPEMFQNLCDLANLYVIENKILPGSRIWKDCRVIARKL